MGRPEGRPTALSASREGCRNRDLGQPALETLELGRVLVELGGAGAALPEDLADEHEPSDVQQEVVELGRVQAATSAGTNSGSRSCSSCGVAGFDSTSTAATTAPATAIAAKT